MKAKVLALVLLVLAAGVSVVFHNCSPVSIKHQSFPEIGETVHLEPVSQAKAAKSENDYKHKLVYFILGGKNLQYNDDAEIVLLGADGQPVHTFKPADLRDMYKSTDCPDYVSIHLENGFEGEGLFCNNSIDLTKVASVVVRRPGKEDKVATSHVREYALDNIDLIAISYTVY